MKNNFTNRIHCKICGSKSLTDVFSIAPQYLSSTFVEDNALEGELSSLKVPMTLTLCDTAKNKKGCGLLQLKEEVSGDLLYRRYFYRSSTNSTMVADLKDVVTEICSKVKLQKEDIVVDIGANDCTMIQFYPDFIQRVGIEPAKNIDWGDVNPSIKIVNDYFGAKELEKKIGSQKVKVFSCCAMFYDLPNPNKFVADIKEKLSADGIWCIQLSYLPLMIKNMNFYDICHEHLSYYSIKSLNALMERHKLHIFDASTNAVNGGSVRVFITHKDNKIGYTSGGQANVENLLAKEMNLNLESASTYHNYYKKMKDLADKVKRYFESELAKGNKIVGLGASTKGNILLQFFGINNEMMPYISEINQVKIGLKTLGSDFELVSESFAASLEPSTYFVLPWYFKDEIVLREAEFLSAGGSLLFPMPYVHLVTKSGEIRL